MDKSAYDIGLIWLTYISLLMLIVPGILAVWYERKQEKKAGRAPIPFPRHRDEQQRAA